MIVRRIGWQGRSRAVLIGDQLNERFGQWRQGWFGERLNEACVLIDQQGMCTADQDCWQLTGAGGGMWFAAPEDAAILLAAEALQLPARAGGLLKSVGDSCLRDLFACLWNAELGGKPLIRQTTEPCGIQDLLRFGALVYRVEGLPIELLVVADRVWCDAQSPRNTSPKPALIDRRSAIGATRVALKATLDLGEIPLLESTGWTAGELLLTDRPRTLRASLSIADRKVHGGAMGLRDGKRTFAIS